MFKPCQRCGKKTLDFYSKHCRKCYSELRKINKKGRTSNVKCEGCNKSLYRRPNELKKKEKIICKKCYNKSLKGKQLSSLKQFYEKIKVDKELYKKFCLSQKRGLKSRKKMSDSRKEYYKTHKHPLLGVKKSKEEIEQRSLKRIGKSNYKVAGSNHYNWKGGITPIDVKLRGIFRISIQKQVFKRDKYTCQLCGQKGGDLQVDHIQKWSEYPELRFCIDNCRTLCMSCHYLITYHKIKPKKINNWGHNYAKIS
jgi:hypothetical protein